MTYKPTEEEIYVAAKVWHKEDYDDGTNALSDFDDMPDVYKVPYKNMAIKILKAAAEVRGDGCNMKDCLNYGGLESDLQALIDVCKKGNLNRIDNFIKANYPSVKPFMFNKGGDDA